MMSGVEICDDRKGCPVPPAPPPKLGLTTKSFDTSKDNFEPLRLHFAINDGDSEEAAKLIQRGLDLDYVNLIHGNTALSLAIIKDQFKIALMVIKAGANVDLAEKTPWRRQPIHLAARVGELEVVECLVDHGASVRALDSMKFTPLHWAAVQGHLKVVKYLVEVAGAEVNAADDRLRTALHRAAENNHLATVRYLLSKGAEINAGDCYGWTPLYQCLVCRQTPLVEELLSSGSDVNLRDHLGQSGLHLVAGGRRDCNLVVLTKTDVNFYTRHLKVATSAVQQAVRGVSNGEDTALAMLLLEYGAEINVFNVYNQSPLTLALEDGNLPMSKLFVEAGSDLSQEKWILVEPYPNVIRQNTEFREWILEKAKDKTRPLVELAKFTVRQCLAPNISPKIAQLPLPRKLREYLHVDFVISDH